MPRASRYTAERTAARSGHRERSRPDDIWPADHARAHRSARSRQGNRAGRRRRKISKAGWCWRILCFLIVGLSLPYLVQWGYGQWQAGQQRLHLQHLTIVSDGLLTEAEIAAQAGIELGMSTRVLPQQIEATLEAVPAIDSAEVQLILPDRLKISVVERVPVAWLSVPELGVLPLRAGGLLLDQTGVAWRCPSLVEGLTLLPTIEVADIAEISEGSVIGHSQVAAALDLIARDPARMIIDVRALGTWGLLCRYGGADDMLVTFHTERIAAGLADLDIISARAAASGTALATANVATEQNIPVTFHGKVDQKKWQNPAVKTSDSNVSEKRRKILRPVQGISR